MKIALSLSIALAAIPWIADNAAAQGMQAGATYTTDVLTIVDGGLRRGTGWVGRADVTVEVDGATIGLNGTTFFGDVIFTHGPDFSGTRVGDAQVVSNVQGDGILRPYEAWAMVALGSGVAAKAGLIDLNTEFDVQTVGAFFLNSSHGIGPDFSQTGQTGPSIFPVTSTAVVLKVDRKSWAARIGLFNGIAGDPDRPRRIRLPLPGRDGALVVGEVEFGMGPFEAQLGAWIDTSNVETVASVATGIRLFARGGHGGYAQVEGRLAGPRDGSGLEGWVRVGATGGETLRIAHYIGAGVTHGSVASRLGIAVAHARQGDRGIRAFSIEGPQARGETVFELGFAMKLANVLTVQPNIQYVINPNWLADVPNALVAGARLAFALND